MTTREFGIGEAGRMSESTPEDEMRAAAIQPSPVAKVQVRCNRCHQLFNRRMAMSSSEGTVCPDCYENMED